MNDISICRDSEHPAHSPTPLQHPAHAPSHIEHATAVGRYIVYAHVRRMTAYVPIPLEMHRVCTCPADDRLCSDTARADFRCKTCVSGCGGVGWRHDIGYSSIFRRVMEAHRLHALHASEMRKMRPMPANPKAELVHFMPARCGKCGPCQRIPKRSWCTACQRVAKNASQCQRTPKRSWTITALAHFLAFIAFIAFMAFMAGLAFFQPGRKVQLQVSVTLPLFW
jgi:hypothetical protein